MSVSTQVIVIVVMWLLWGALHSAMVSERAKDAFRVRFASGDAGYRRLYNVVALVTIAPLLGVSLIWSRGSETVVDYHGALVVIPWIVRAVAVLIFLDTLKVYDGREFAGLKAPADETRPGFSFTHRFVRHPWYFALLLLLWLRPLTVIDLATNVALTIYLIVGARLEEGRLEARFGKLWRNYVGLVPMLLPSPFRYASVDNLSTLGRD